MHDVLVHRASWEPLTNALLKPRSVTQVFVHSWEYGRSETLGCCSGASVDGSYFEGEFIANDVPHVLGPNGRAEKAVTISV